MNQDYFLGYYSNLDELFDIPVYNTNKSWMIDHFNLKVVNPVFYPEYNSNYLHIEDLKIFNKYVTLDKSLFYTISNTTKEKLNMSLLDKTLNLFTISPSYGDMFLYKFNKHIFDPLSRRFYLGFVFLYPQYTSSSVFI